MIQRTAITFASLSVLAGCATAPLPPLKPMSFEPLPPEPVCINARHCEAMMVAAADALPRITGMRLQIVSPALLETHKPPRSSYGLLNGRVQLVPTGPNTSAVAAAFECNVSPGSGCDHQRHEAAKLFRMEVNFAGDQYLRAAGLPTARSGAKTSQ